MRTSSLHRALPTIVLRACASDAHWKRMFSHVDALIAKPHGSEGLLPALRAALDALRTFYRAYKGDVAVADVDERLGHVTWETWMHMVADITEPPSGFPESWGVEIDPRGSAAGPSSCFFLTTSVRFLRLRGHYAAASWEVVREHSLKRVMRVFNAANIGLSRHCRRAWLLLRLLTAYAVADASTSPVHPSRKCRRRANECMNYVMRPLKVRILPKHVALILLRRSRQFVPFCSGQLLHKLRFKNFAHGLHIRPQVVSNGSDPRHEPLDTPLFE